MSVLAAVALLAGSALLASSCRHGWGALWVLADLSGLELPLTDRRPPVTRSSVVFAHLDGELSADLYRPANGLRAGLVLVPGAAPDGRNDRRLVEFAHSLGRSGFLVLVPDIVSMRELRPAAESIAEIAGSAGYLHDQAGLPDGFKVGIGAFSVAVGPAVLAALEPRAKDKVDFLLLVGGYHDLVRTLAYLTTGYFNTDGQRLYRPPNAYGKWVYALGNAQRLEDAKDRELLTRLARRKLEDPDAAADDLLVQLSAPAVAVYEMITNTEPGRVEALVDALPDEVRGEIAGLDLAHRDLSAVTGRCILVHGLDDDIVPYSESLRLAGALSGCRVDLYLLDGLQHVDRKFSGLDVWRFWRLLQRILSQRE